MFVNHLTLIGIVVILLLVSFFMRPVSYERFEDKPMTEEATVTVETEKKSEPTVMDTLNEVRKLMKCDGTMDIKDPQITYDAIQTLLQCKKPSA